MRLDDLTGRKFGRLTVIERAPNKGRKTCWLCRCDCGNTTIVIADNIKNGQTTSCGCYHREKAAEMHFKHGGTDTRLYRVWNDMRSRCSCSYDKEYKRYGARGIRVCKEWEDFSTFQKWALDNGYRDDVERGKCTLDRIDNDGSYCPSNCRWVSVKEQSNNRRSNRYIEYRGECHTTAEWSEILGINRSMLDRRINALGWSIERAFTTPKCKNQYG